MSPCRYHATLTENARRRKAHRSPGPLMVLPEQLPVSSGNINCPVDLDVGESLQQCHGGWQMIILDPLMS